jgi:hypothetical protein
MNARFIALALVTARLTLSAFAADDATEKKPTRNEAMRAQMIEDAKKQAAKSPAPATAKSAPTAAKPEPASSSPIVNTPASATDSSAASDKPAPPATPAPKPDELATVLPKVEVNRGKLHPLARELYEKEKEITREKELTKPTELDKALNNPKVSIPLFGGQSTASRASVASERTSLLEAEADLIEEIGRAKTKEQKEELRKQLDELKKVRRELEHAIR